MSAVALIASDAAALAIELMGQERPTSDTDDQTACAFCERQSSGDRLANRCDAACARQIAVVGDRLGSCPISRTPMTGSWVLPRAEKEPRTR